MSLTVTLNSSSTNSLDVRWTSTTSPMQQSVYYLVNVAPVGATTHEWTLVVRDSKASAIRLDLERSGIVERPLVTVKRCRVTKLTVLDDERWIVLSTANSAAGSGGASPLERLFGRMEVSSPTSTTPSAAGNSLQAFAAN